LNRMKVGASDVSQLMAISRTYNIGGALRCGDCAQPNRRPERSRNELLQSGLTYVAS
jgi:hypothetical protein